MQGKWKKCIFCFIIEEIRFSGYNVFLRFLRVDEEEGGIEWEREEGYMEAKLACEVQHNVELYVGCIAASCKPFYCDRFIYAFQDETIRGTICSF